MRHLTLALVLRVAGAAGGLAFVSFLARNLSASDFGAVIYALSLIGLLGGVAAAGWAPTILRHGARFHAAGQQAAFQRLLRRGFVTVIAGGLAAALPVLALHIFGTGNLSNRGAIWLLVLSISIVLWAVIVFLSSAMRARGNLGWSLAATGPLRQIVPVGLIAGYSIGGLITATVALVGNGVALALIALALASRSFTLPQTAEPSGSGSVEPVEVSRRLWVSNAGWMCLQHLDVIAIGIVSTPVNAGLYLAARKVASLMGLVFDGLRSVYAPALSVAFSAANGHENFVRQARRCNIAFLLGGGSVAIMLWLVLPKILMAIGPDFADARHIVLVLIVGHLSFSVLGATGTLMIMTELERARTRIVWAALPLGLVVMLMAGWRHDVLGVAAVQSGATSLVGLCSAAVVWRRLGVKPAILSIIPRRARPKTAIRT